MFIYNISHAFKKTERDNSMSKKVTFLDSYKDYCEDEGEVSLMSDEESFCEITTSETDSLSSSDNDNSVKLELVLQSACGCSLRSAS